MSDLLKIRPSPISINENYHADGFKLPEPSLETSNAFRGEEWGKVNARVGGRTAGYEELAFGLGIIRNYFNSFFNLEENPILNYLVKILTGCSDGLEGKRDQEMYGEVYGHGVTELSGKNPEELKTDAGMLRNLKSEDAYIDDYMQNKREEGLFGERLVAKSGEWATKFSMIKPIAHLISGFAGNSWRAGVQTILDFPAKVLWRVRFFKNALHSNFVTTVWDLAKFKLLSLIGIGDAKDYENKVKEAGDMSAKYFQSKDSNYKPETNTGLGLYTSMLTDRMKEHFNSILDPKTALENKSKPKEEGGFLNRTTEEKRKADPSKTPSNGYVDPNSGNDQKEQRRLALVDFTGPICATLGLIGTVVFDPLKILWGACGFETGKNLITALSASRKSFSLINYIPRFMMKEMNEGSSYTELDTYMNKEEGPNKAISELRYARKSRYDNAMLGMVVAAGNICEPLLHFKRDIIGDSKLGNFLIDSIIKFNDSFFLRFFSKRREVQGREEYLKEALKERGVKFTSDADFIQKLSLLTNAQCDELMKGRASEQEEGVIDTFVGKLIGGIEAAKQAISGKLATDQIINKAAA